MRREGPLILQVFFFCKRHRCRTDVLWPEFRWLWTYLQEFQAAGSALYLGHAAAAAAAAGVAAAAAARRTWP